MPRSKLTDAQIAEIRRLFGSKTTKHEWNAAKLASAFGTSKAMIFRLVKDVTPGKTFMGIGGLGLDLDSASPWARY